MIDPTPIQQLANRAAVVGTWVRIWNEKTGTWSKKTARIVAYHPPLVWELDRSVYGTHYRADEHVQTLDGQRVSELLA